MVQTERRILVYVRDADNHLVEGATISWSANGRDLGRIDSSDGHGTITIHDPDAVVEVTVTYKGYSETRRLALEQQDCTVVLPDLHVNASWRVAVERHFPALIGIAFVLIVIVLAFAFPNPSRLQIHIILAVLSLGGGAFGTEISGMIKVDLSIGTKLVIGATGAAAIFVILYFTVPAS